jgi:hypothetical protein
LAGQLKERLAQKKTEILALLSQTEPIQDDDAWICRAIEREQCLPPNSLTLYPPGQYCPGCLFCRPPSA